MEIVTKENWIVVDGLLNEAMFGSTPRTSYHLARNAKNTWVALPRVEMTNGGISLQQGLLDYNHWIGTNIPQQGILNLLWDIERAKIEDSYPGCSVALGRDSHWLCMAANRNGMGVNEFVLSKLRRFAEEERESAKNEFMLRGLKR